MPADFRVERDSMGELKVPASALWGAQTQRAVNNFPISGLRMPPAFIRALALVKWAAARTNRGLGLLPEAVADAIEASALEVANGMHEDQFPIDVFQTGSGTSSNMNANEVIARLATRALGSPVHANDHVNMSQSSNDSIPSAIHIAAALELTQKLLPALEHLAATIEAKAREVAGIVKTGRTHLMDAMPVRLDQELGGWAAQVHADLRRLQGVLPRLTGLAQGGTAVGTGINAAPGFAEAAAAEIAKLTKLPFITAPNKFTVQGAHDALVQLSGTFRTLAASLYKIANDIRLMSCGPRAGFAELEIPENEPGSSIMPGKVNPTQCEALAMIAVQVMANDVAVGFGGAGGYLEMNVYKPLMIYNITHSITIMADGCTNFRKFLVEGTKPNLKKIKEYVDRSLMLVTALAPVIGYDKASKIAHYAMDNDLTLKEAALKLAYVTEAEFNKIVDPAKMVRPYVATE